MNGFPDKMTDHQVLTNTTNIPINMGLQAHPCSNKRTIEGLEEPAGRSNYNQQQQQQQQQQHNNLGPRAAKQQCTIRVGVEAPDHLVASETSVPNNNWYHRDAVQQQPTTTTPDYETYVNGFNAAQVRASTPYSVSSSTNSSSYYSATAENLPVPAVEYSYNTTTTTTTVSNNNNSAETGYSTSQNVYQNLTSMLPVTNGGGESLADRFERVCSSPRPYVQYNNVAPTREEPAGYHYGNNETARSDDRYWTFGYTSHCPKKSSPGYAKSNNYGYPDNNGFGHKVGYQQHHQQQLATTGQQTIQRDENGKSYLELGAKAAVQPEWVRPWPAQQQQQQHHQQHYVSSAPAVVKSCSKCGHVLLNNSSRSLAQQPCYRHQRLSVLSLSMLKLNRYRQCSDPSLHRSVLICNTLRHIEDEMEREGLVCNPSAEVATNNCDTCCCSHCGTVFNNSSTPTAKSDTSPAAYNNNNNNTTTTSNSTSNVSSNMNNNNAAVYDSTPDPNFANNSNNNSSSTSSSTSTTISTSTSNNNNSTSSSSDYNSSAAKTTTSVANADEDDSGFGDEDSRDIDWSSVFSMSTTSGFEVSGGSNSNGSSSDSYLCDSNSSDPSLFAGPGAELVNDLGPNWKSSHCGSSSGGSSSSWTSDASDFSGVRWKSELGDELEGFVHILVGS